MIGFVTMLIFSGTAKGESRWYSGTNNNGEWVRDQTIEINFDNPKYVSKVYFETACESGLGIFGNIQFYDGFGDNQVIVSTKGFSKLVCGDTINVEPDIKTTKVKVLLSQAMPAPYGGMSQPVSHVSLTTWKVYAGDTPITTPSSTPTTPIPTPIQTQKAPGEKTPVSDGSNYWMWLLLLLITVILIVILRSSDATGTRDGGSFTDPPKYPGQIKPIDPIILKKGEEFEDYVKTLFNEYFEIMPRTEAYPDYNIKFNPTREKFVIECKWKKSLSENSFNIDDRQLKNYKEYKIKKNIPFFMVLGLGGYPSNPDKIFIIPLDRINKSEIKYEYLSLFEKNNLNKRFYFDPATKKLS